MRLVIPEIADLWLRHWITWVDMLHVDQSTTLRSSFIPSPCLLPQNRPERILCDVMLAVIFLSQPDTTVFESFTAARFRNMPNVFSFLTGDRYCYRVEAPKFRRFE